LIKFLSWFGQDEPRWNRIGENVHSISIRDLVPRSLSMIFAIESDTDYIRLIIPVVNLHGNYRNVCPQLPLFGIALDPQSADSNKDQTTCKE
jgi:hypothetical protein